MLLGWLRCWAGLEWPSSELDTGPSNIYLQQASLRTLLLVKQKAERTVCLEAHCWVCEAVLSTVALSQDFCLVFADVSALHVWLCLPESCFKFFVLLSQSSVAVDYVCLGLVYGLVVLFQSPCFCFSSPFKAVTWFTFLAPVPGYSSSLNPPHPWATRPVSCPSCYCPIDCWEGNSRSECNFFVLCQLWEQIKLLIIKWLVDCDI